MVYKRRKTYKRRAYAKKPTYKRKTYTKVKRNTSRINKLVKSTMIKTYWKHNDDARVDTLWPSITEPVYRSFTPLVPTNMELLFNKMTAYTDQQKVYVNGCKVNLTLTMGNARQALQPIDYSIFCVKIKPRMRTQFYQQTSGQPTHSLNLYENVHYTGNLPAGQARVGSVGNNLANIRLNPDIFDIHYYKHGYFSTNIKNQTSIGSDTDNVTSLQLRRCSFYIPYKCEIKSDTWTEGTQPVDNRKWTDLNQDEIPLFNRYHIFIFTSANYQNIPNTPAGQGANNLLQSNIQCVFNCTSSN